MEDARAGAFDVLIAETLDRLSRDQEDVPALFKRLRFASVTTIGINLSRHGRGQRSCPPRSAPSSTTSSRRSSCSEAWRAGTPAAHALIEALRSATAFRWI